jgi:hypothetical protein
MTYVTNSRPRKYNKTFSIQGLGVPISHHVNSAHLRLCQFRNLMEISFNVATILDFHKAKNYLNTPNIDWTLVSSGMLRRVALVRTDV